MSVLSRLAAAALLAACFCAPASAATIVQRFSMTQSSGFGPGATFEVDATVTTDTGTGAMVYSPTFLVDGQELTGGTTIIENLSGNLRGRSTFRNHPDYGTFELFIRFLPRLTEDGVFGGVFIFSRASGSESFSFANVEVTVGSPPVTAVPEPTGLALSAVGLAALGFLRRRRRVVAAA